MRKFVCWVVAMVCGSVVWSETPMPELSPSIHVNAIYGTSSAEHPEEFAPGGHDPKREEALILQSLEPSLSLRWGEYIQGFATGLAFTDANDDLEWEWEEYFLKATNLPGGLELRGGRMLNRVGFHNPTHLHGWNTVDAPLAHSLFLGEDGLATEGADLSVYMDTRHPTVLTIGFGQRPAHDHDHGHDDDHDDDHDEDPHDDHDEHGYEDDHGHDDHGYEGFGVLEEYRVADDVITAGLRHDRIFDDFHVLRLAAFGGMGDSELGESSWFAGAGVEYQWRENGLEPGGRAVRWRSEVIRFRGDAGLHEHGHEEEHDEDHDDHDHDHDHDHGEEVHDDDPEEGGAASSWGFTTEVVFEAHPHAHPFARIDYVDGVDGLELSDWTRYTAGLTVPFGSDPGAFVRFQANADERGSESEQSFWAQIGFRWGGPEVR